MAVHGNIREIVSIAHTALGEWNRYPLADEGVGVRTVYVDTMNVSSTDFGLTPELRDQLFANGQAAAVKFLAAWDRVHPRPAPAASVAPTVIVAPEVVITREAIVIDGGGAVADGGAVVADGGGVVADGAPGGTAAGAAFGAAAGAAVAEGAPAGGAATEVGP